MSQPTKPTVVDRISDLSDDILCHILSFLPTKQAFTTILLSKRWNLLCYSLTTLSFDDKTIPIRRCDKRTGFFRFIDTLMLSPHVTDISLKTFHLKFHCGDCDSDFYAWIEAAKRRRIEEFQLESKYFNYTVNPTFFISQTLVVLKLKGLLFKYEIFCADLPLLKTLHLKRVRFEYQNDIIKLLKSSPNLEDLNTSFRISEKNFEVQEVKSLFLSKLVRADIRANNVYPIDVPFNVIHNVEFLRLERLQVPSLQTNTKEIFKRSPVFQNLTHAKLWFRGFFDGWDVVVEFLRHCPKLQILYIRKVCGVICSCYFLYIYYIF
jgi:hypothetical protein